MFCIEPRVLGLDRLHFTRLSKCIKAFSLCDGEGHVLSSSMPGRLTGLLSEPLDVTSLLFQKPAQFPLNHKATAQEPTK